VGISQLNDNSENVSETQEGPQQPGEFSEPDNSGQLSKQCSKPLLSICVPTYNRSKFLRVMLQALLPQVAECGDQVEVWVLDNASPDDTQVVIEESRSFGAFQSVRNDENIGPLRNILKGTCELATGSFVWVLGDHNLMMPGALRRVLRVLSEHTRIKVFYSNFRVTKYPDNWPESAIGGYDGPYHYSGNSDLSDRRVTHLNELFQAESYLGTQAYVHIVETRIWKDYWSTRNVAESYIDGITSYPHTYMLTDVHFSTPAYYMGTTQITIFNGAQSWGDFQTQRKVFLVGLPDLIGLFRERGMNPERIAAARQCCQQSVYLGFVDAFRNAKGSALLILLQSILMVRFRTFFLCRPIVKAFGDAKCAPCPQAVHTVADGIRRCRNYLTRDCRPARWLRGRS
jgi:glycosyltransferase involved in cell wall biosynthesis